MRRRAFILFSLFIDQFDNNDITCFYDTEDHDLF